MNQDKMNMYDTDDEITINVMDLLKAIVKKLPVMIVTALIFAIIAFVGTKFLIVPEYTATTKVYILLKQSETGNVTYSDFQLGSYLTQDYSELVKSRPVMETVIDKLGLDLSVGELKDKISITAAEDTRILGISATHTDPEMAQQIADAVREEASVSITEIMDVDAVNVVEAADLPDAPSSPDIIVNTILGAVLGIILIGACVVVAFLMDDTIKTSADVEKYLGLSVLTEIPRSREGRSLRRDSNKYLRE